MKDTKVNFSGQTIYTGLDVHKKSWAVTIKAYNQIKLERFVMTPSAQGLVNHLQKNYPGAKYKSVYEAGFCGFWIHRQLLEKGIDNIVVSPADVPTGRKEVSRRNDIVDSNKLLKGLMNNNLEAIYVPTEREEALRILTRQRAQLSKDKTRVKNRIKGLLHFVGIAIPENREMAHWSRKFIEHLFSLEIKEQPTKLALDKHLNYLIYLREEMAALLKNLRSIVKSDKEGCRVVKRLSGIPGVGFTTAATLYTELMNMERFSNFSKLSTFVGFAPDFSSSGEKEKILGLTKRHNKYLRNLLVESAWIAIRKDKLLTKKYGVLVRRMSPQEAIIIIAKKMLKIIMHLWLKDEDYRYEFTS